MRSVMHNLSIGAGWADALFVSALQRCEHPNAGQVRQAVDAAIRAYGQCGCAERMAQEFGDHPETAVTRMRWARELVGEAFSEPVPEPAGAGPGARRMAAGHSHAA
jgi:hypothetical protein